MPAPKDPKKREEWIEKQRTSHRGKHPSKETIEKMRAAHTGVSFSEERKANIRTSKQGRKLPSLQGKHHSEERKAKNSIGVKRAWESSEYRERRSASIKKLWENPKYREKFIAAMNRPEVKAKNSAAAQKRWQNPEYVEKQRKSRNIKPNKPEKFFDKLLQKLFPNHWKYVGDFQKGVGGRNPDFININGQKKIIEFFGDFWHGEKKTGIPNKQHEQERINYFAQYSYQTLVIWECELENLDLLTEKIIDFHNM